MTWASETAEYIQHHRDNLSPEYLRQIRKHWKNCYEPQVHLLPTTWLGKQRLKQSMAITLVRHGFIDLKMARRCLSQKT